MLRRVIAAALVVSGVLFESQAYSMDDDAPESLVPFSEHVDKSLKELEEKYSEINYEFTPDDVDFCKDSIRGLLKQCTSKARLHVFEKIAADRIKKRSSFGFCDHYIFWLAGHLLQNQISTDLKLCDAIVDKVSKAQVAAGSRKAWDGIVAMPAEVLVGRFDFPSKGLLDSNQRINWEAWGRFRKYYEAGRSKFRYDKDARKYVISRM